MCAHRQTNKKIILLFFSSFTPILFLQVTCVLVAFDEHISYHKILKAATYIKKRNCLFLATNEDSALPMPGDMVIPGQLYILKSHIKLHI